MLQRPTDYVESDGQCHHEAHHRTAADVAESLTYARIVAVPVVVAAMYWQNILQGGIWLRWVALAIFIAAGITDILDGYFARMWDSSRASAACSIRSPTSSWSRPAC